MTEQEIGHVTHWFSSIGVAGIHIDRGELHEGDVIHILGHTSDIEQRVGSMEIEHRHVTEAHPGDDVGIVIGGHARDHDTVYLVS